MNTGNPLEERYVEIVPTILRHEATQAPVQAKKLTGVRGSAVGSSPARTAGPIGACQVTTQPYMHTPTGVELGG